MTPGTLVDANVLLDIFTESEWFDWSASMLEEAAHDGAPIGGATDNRGYARPRAFFVGPAAQMVRGGLYGKAHDGYTGYYMEP